MGLDMDLYKVPKGKKIDFDEIIKQDSLAYWRKYYELDTIFENFGFYSSCDTYVISKEELKEIYYEILKRYKELNLKNLEKELEENEEETRKELGILEREIKIIYELFDFDNYNLVYIGCN